MQIHSRHSFLSLCQTTRYPHSFSQSNSWNYHTFTRVSPQKPSNLFIHWCFHNMPHFFGDRWMSVCPTFFSRTRIQLTDDRYGFKCRFLGGHIRISDLTSSTEHLSLLQDEDKKAHNAITGKEMNYVSADVLKFLRSRKVGHSSSIPAPLKWTGYQYPFPISDSYLASLGLETTSEAAKSQTRSRKTHPKGGEDVIVIEEPQQIEEVEMNTDEVNADVLVGKRTADPVSASSSGESHRDSPDARVRFAEKKRLNWRGQTCPFLFWT